MSGVGEERPHWVLGSNTDLLVTIWKRTACSSRNQFVPISSANLCVPDATAKASREPAALTQRTGGSILKGQLCASVISSIERAQSLQKRDLECPSDPVPATVTHPAGTDDTVHRGGVGGCSWIFQCIVRLSGCGRHVLTSVMKLAQLWRGRVAKRRRCEDPDGRKKWRGSH